MATYSNFSSKAISSISALSIMIGGLDQFNLSYNSPISSKSPQVVYNIPYANNFQSQTSETVEIRTDITDLKVIEAFARKILSGMAPIDNSIQKIIDEYFWDML